MQLKLINVYRRKGLQPVVDEKPMRYSVMKTVVQSQFFVLAISVTLMLSGCGGSSSGSQSNNNAGTGDDPDVTGDSTPSTDDSFVTFESGQVRPLALSEDGSTLFATNTPNGTLEIFSVLSEGLQLDHTVPVGMEPVAVALNGDMQAWVVNHLSDSISIVDLVSTPPRVTATLLVGDEPRDIVFAGEDAKFAFITAAHRGQNGPDDTPIDAQLFTPDVGRADVWVFDANEPGDSLGGDPLNVLSLFGDTPRALTVSPDGETVYAAVMHSGNQTTAIGEDLIAKPGPVQSSDGAQQPDTSLIVQFDGSSWVDDTGSAVDMNDITYDSRVRFSLPDHDVFAINATGSPTVIDQYSGVGTTLFNMVTHPLSGALYVSNTEANNLTRFEGHGESSTTVRGNIAQSRVTVINDQNVEPRNLNSHIDRSQPSASAEQRNLSMAQPLGMAITSDGSNLYVAGFGSQKIAVYNTTELETNNFEVSASNQIVLSAGGPTAVVLDEARGRLYAMTRFNNSIATVDTTLNSEISSVALYNPEPDHVIEGRSFLYDAGPHSSHGDASCGLCHVFGDVDAMAWDLGNPDQTVVANPNRFVNFVLTPNERATFHPLKGPMTTQSLRGLANSGPMHWRGDRTGANAKAGESLEHAAFTDFNVAFPELLGRDVPLSEADMSVFADFALEIHYPPNPIRALDNSLNAAQAEGRRIYFEDSTTGEQFTCNDCHTLDPLQGHFGTSGESSIEGDEISQEFKVAHLRNAYQKVGKFGNSGRFSGSELEFGDQIKGFGFMHDGNMDTLDNFLKGEVFRFDDDPDLNDKMRSQVVEFIMAIDSELAPIVGQQVTLSGSTGADSDARLDLLIDRALVNAPRPECDLIAKGVLLNEPRGFLLDESGNFQSDKDGESFTVNQLKELSAQDGNAITFTCVPPGSGSRMGIDQDNNGTRNADDRDQRGEV